MYLPHSFKLLDDFPKYTEVMACGGQSDRLCCFMSDVVTQHFSKCSGGPGPSRSPTPTYSVVLGWALRLISIISDQLSGNSAGPRTLLWVPILWWILVPRLPLYIHEGSDHRFAYFYLLATQKLSSEAAILLCLPVIPRSCVWRRWVILSSHASHSPDLQS